jgi:hypothetical protein
MIEFSSLVSSPALLPGPSASTPGEDVKTRLPRRTLLPSFPPPAFVCVRILLSISHQGYLHVARGMVPHEQPSQSHIRNAVGCHAMAVHFTVQLAHLARRTLIEHLQLGDRKRALVLSLSRYDVAQLAWR